MASLKQDALTALLEKVKEKGAPAGEDAPKKDGECNGKCPSCCAE